MNKKTTPEIIGEIVGFGLALFIFTSVFYFISSRFGLLTKININISYFMAVSIIMGLYVIYTIIKRGLK